MPGKLSTTFIKILHYMIIDEETYTLDNGVALFQNRKYKMEKKIHILYILEMLLLQ